VSPVKYKLGFYIPEDDILHSHRRENVKSYMSLNLINEAHIITVCMKFETVSPFLTCALDGVINLTLRPLYPLGNRP
jgi:hypothetical protein